MAVQAAEDARGDEEAARMGRVSASEQRRPRRSGNSAGRGLTAAAELAKPPTNVGDDDYAERRDSDK